MEWGRPPPFHRGRAAAWGGRIRFEWYRDPAQAWGRAAPPGWRRGSRIAQARRGEPAELEPAFAQNLLKHSRRGVLTHTLRNTLHQTRQIGGGLSGPLASGAFA